MKNGDLSVESNHTVPELCGLGLGTIMLGKVFLHSQ